MSDRVFETTLEDSAGARPFRLTIQEGTRTGEVLLPQGETYKIKNVRRVGTHDVEMIMSLTSFGVKTVVGTTKHSGELVMTISIAGTL